MNRSVVLLRHGKSDWQSAARSDHDRPLSGRGKRDASRIGRFLTAVGAAPDYVLCSTAVRAVKTLKRAAKAGDWKAPVELCENLYLPSPEVVFGSIQNAPDDSQTLLVVGHEPTWSEVLRLLTGATAVMPTCAAALISLDVINWSQVEPDCGTLNWLVVPSLLAKK